MENSLKVATVKNNRLELGIYIFFLSLNNKYDNIIRLFVLDIDQLHTSWYNIFDQWLVDTYK